MADHRLPPSHSSRLRPCFPFRAFRLAVLLSLAHTLPYTLSAQLTPSDAPTSIRGLVLNRLTREPISRVLVYSPDNRFATLTDDRGHFEFKFPAPGADQTATASASGVTGAIGFSAPIRVQAYVPNVLMARKPGFLEQDGRQQTIVSTPAQSDLVIYLDPEGVISGHVRLADPEADQRIRVELFRRDFREGHEHWESAGQFTCWTDGEFRFYELPAGTYKLITHEQLDRDPLTFNPGGPQFGYPPMYYPNSLDFSTATLIQIATGGAFQANLSPVRRAYYPVKISVANATAGTPTSVAVYPQGHPGPGYSLGYDPSEQIVQGLLPDGNYTLQLVAHGPNSASGSLNFTVKGAPLEGPTLNLFPNVSLSVNVKDEFASQSPAEEGFIVSQVGDSQGAPPIRYGYVSVVLMPAEEFGSTPGAGSHPVVGGQGNALVIDNVLPGRYWVRASSGRGYPASVQWGGADLMHQPLTVGFGGSSTPIEVTLKDDWAQVSGVIDNVPAATLGGMTQSGEQQQQFIVYFLPVGDIVGPSHVIVAGPDGSFSQTQLPPGTYRVLAFDQQHTDLEYGSPEAQRRFESKGQVIRAEAGQKQTIRLSLVSESEAQ